jgi:cytidyltransferase-like protein
MNKQEFGSIHGRFQPFHKGHLEYAREALTRCQHLLVGVTQYEISSLKWSGLDVARHRSEPSANPFTFAERHKIIEASLLENRVGLNQFSIVPFPIETPNLMSQYISTDVVIYTTIYDDWNRAKIKLLEKEGYKVEVLWERTHKAYEGKRLRELMMATDPKWKEMVSSSAVDLISLGASRL